MGEEAGDKVTNKRRKEGGRGEEMERGWGGRSRGCRAVEGKHGLCLPSLRTSLPAPF